MITPVYIFLGPSGSGKDTQAELFAAKHEGLQVVSTGELFRQWVADNREGCEKIREAMNSGSWVSDDVVFKVLEDYLSKVIDPVGFIFTGFPRSVGQAEKLDALMVELKMEIKNVIHLDTDPEATVARMKERRELNKEAGKVREDDTEENLRTRLKNYALTITPILDYYQKQKRLMHIDNNHPIAEVEELIDGAINA